MKKGSRILILIIVLGLIVVAINVIDYRLQSIDVVEEAQETTEEADEAEDEVVEEEVDVEKEALLEEHGFAIQGFDTIDTPLVGEDGTQVFELDEENSITVMTAADEGIIRHSYGENSEEAFHLGSVPGFDITGSSPKDGSAVRYILLFDADTMYVLKGTDEYLDGIIAGDISFK